MSSSSSQSSESIGNTSSSSSSNDLFAPQINLTLVDQSNGNLLPFSFIGESGYSVNLGTGSELGWIITSSQSPNLDYEAIINRDTSGISSVTNIDEEVYVPNDSDSYYQHQAPFYVDVISKDDAGIREVRTHVEPSAYEFEAVEQSFNIPKFTWTNEFQGASNTVSTTTTISVNSMWVGTEDGLLKGAEYTSDSASLIYEEDLTNQVGRVVFGPNKDKIYVSTSTNLYRYSSEYFLNSSDLEQQLSTTNTNSNLISLDDGSIWAVQTYNGKVIKMDNNFVVQKEYVGFDAPYKIIKSEYHNLYIVAGTHLVWTIDDSTNEAVNIYEVNDHKIVDIAVAEDGKLCMLLNGSSVDRFRVVGNDFYSLVLDEKIIGASLRYCVYCNEGRFYALAELDNPEGGLVYGALHYTFDSNSGTLQVVSSQNALSTTTTTTTLGTTVKAVEIKSPNGGEILELGEKYEIEWISSKSASDLVKIDLYKEGVFYSLITEGTPNTGLFEWNVPETLKKYEYYKIRITWLSASSDASNYDDSDNFFSIGIGTATTTTTTTTKIAEEAIGIDFDATNDWVIMMLKSGVYGIFSLSAQVFYGMIETGILNPSSFAIKNAMMGTINDQTQVRIFVGSNSGWSDRWDSGVIETSLMSMYYGGGDNLVPGVTYYVHIQTYSGDRGWGDLQIKEFTMPR